MFLLYPTEQIVHLMINDDQSPNQTETSEQHLSWDLMTWASNTISNIRVTIAALNHDQYKFLQFKILVTKTATYYQAHYFNFS